MGDSKTTVSAAVTQNDMSLHITPDKLDGSNYSSWSQSVRIYITGRGKWSYVSGKKKAPAEADASYAIWEEENAMVQSWLLNSMTRDLRAIFLRLSTAKDVWDAVTQTYSIEKDASKLYELRRQALATRQNGEPLSAYYGKLQQTWQEIDFLRPGKLKCADDVAARETEISEERLYDFLAGLDPHLDHVRSQVLTQTPLPSVRAAYALVNAEANRQTIMLVGPQVEGSAIVAAPSRFPRGVSNSRSGGSKVTDTRKCTYCDKDKHTRDTCFKLHGYPDWWVQKKENQKKSIVGSQAHLSTPTSSVPRVDQSAHSVSPTTASTSLVDAGNFGFALNTTFGAPNKPWIIDSGASDHMTNNSSWFASHTTPPLNTVKVANGISIPVLGAGSISLTPCLSLSSVLHVPNLSHNLLSIGKLTNQLNCLAIFSPTHCWFQDIQTKALIGHGRERGGLYYLDLPPDCEKTSYSCQVEAKQFEASEKIWLWHKRLGHPSFQYLQYLFPSLFSKVKVSNFHCETCIFSKNHRVSFPLSSNKSDVPFSLIHSDVWGPFHIPTHTGAKYFVSFIDDCTRVSWVYLLKNKSEVMSVFPIFHQMIQTQFNAKIQVVRSDNGKEYLNYGLGTFFQQEGIIHQTSCPHTPQQNGIAERKNRHLLDVARSLCFAMHVPKRFWGDAIHTAVFLINRMPSRVLQFQTPIQTLSQYHSLPSLLHIPPKVFGCVCYVHVHMQNRDKLDPRAIKCMFIGYSATQKGYRCYYPPNGKIFVSMDVTFQEQEAYFSEGDSVTSLQGEMGSKEEEQWPLDIGGMHSSDEHLSDAGDGPNLPNDEAKSGKILKVYERTRKRGDKGKEKEKVADEIDHPHIDPLIDQLSDQSAATHTNYPEVTTHSPSLQPTIFDESNHEISLSADPNEPHHESGSRYPIRENRGIPPVRYGYSSTKGIQYPISNFVSSHRLSDSYIAFANQLSSVSIPNKLQDALKNPKWKKAMIEEMEALRKNSTWELVKLPEGKKHVGCRWVFTVKHKADGSVERYKARLVAKGYTQTYGIDYQETFAPVAKINTIRVLMSLAANLGWPLRQFDVKNAFLHGDLDEEIYMDLPPGFTTTCDIGKVCRLRKSLYGLKQSPRAWFGRFAQSMRNYGFKQTQADHTLFLKHDKGKLTALIVYVDDMVVTGNDVEGIQKLQMYLAKEFEMKDLGTLKYFLGIEVARSKHGIFLSQKKYVIDLLTETGMLACKPADTPIEQNHRLGDYPDQVSANKERYQRLVGRLIYLSHTRPDIAYAVSVVSQFMHRPSEAHMDAVQRILRYLKSAPGKGLMFSNHGHQEVEGYTDADWAGSVTDRRSTSGYFTFVGGNLVTWRSKKQHVVARSSAEAEFRGMAHGVQELLWLKILLRELGFNSTKPSNLYCDNKAAISIAHNPVQHDRTKHVEVDRHFIKERLVDGTINLPYVKSDDQLADILTKAVSSRIFHLSLSKLGIRDIYAPT